MAFTRTFFTILLFSVALAQPPRGNGQGGNFLIPLRPREIVPAMPEPEDPLAELAVEQSQPPSPADASTPAPPDATMSSSADTPAPAPADAPTPAPADPSMSSPAAAPAPVAADVPESAPDDAPAPVAVDAPEPALADEPAPAQANAQAPAPVTPLLQRQDCRLLRCRTLTGRCTSTTDPDWGEARRPQLSFFRSRSSSTPTGADLRSAREISNIVSNQEEDIFNEQNLNELFTYFGQFIDHNLVATPLSDERLDIPIPDDDPLLSGPTLEFRRSERGVVSPGSSIERPINTLSSALDLVAVYGPNVPRNVALREPDSGKLRTSAGDLLPFNTEGFNNAPSTSAAFFFAGDHRANEHPVLTSLHTLFVREHNRLVDKIVERFPFWTNDQVYEMARKLNIMQFQKIVYEEFYPAITGRRLRYRGFRSRANPTVSDIFSTAAFRVGHTMVNNMVTRIDAGGSRSTVPMIDSFFRPGTLARGIDDLLRGAALTRAQDVDPKVQDLLRNQLFEFVEGEEGLDLVAMNIQRGRDHAIPTFNEIRQIFRIPRARDFSDISSDPEVASNLAEAYDSVDDVEAWIGMVSEDKARGAGMGRTMLAVWQGEFTRLMDGDQFFFRRRNLIPRVVRRRLRRCIRDILGRRRIFRDIIRRNTDIPDSQLPREIFKLRN